MSHQLHSNSRSLNTKLILFFIALFVSFGTISQTVVNTLPELLPYLDDDNANIVVAPGVYTITAADIENGTYGTPRFVFSGNNSTYDFTGVTINFAADVYTSGHSMSHIQTLGNYNVIKNLTMVDLCSKYGMKVSGGVNIQMDGSYNRIEGFHMTVKGSYPYGYGDVFGKGGPYTIKHYKHSAFLMRGLHNHALNDTIIHRSYGHAMFMQGADYPTIEGCYIKGEIRLTDDMLAETSGPAFDIDFLTIYGYRLLPGYAKSTGEEGIRAYDGGSTIIDGIKYTRGTSNPTILNNTIINMRGGVTLTHATGTKYIEGCTAIGCERGYAIGSGKIVDCYADAKYGAVFGVDYTSDKNISAEITVIPYEGEACNGSNNIASIVGRGHDITIRSTDPSPDQYLKIEIGGNQQGLSRISANENRYAEDININNWSNIPLYLSNTSSFCTGSSGGMVTDLGGNNTINHVPISVLTIEAENYTAMSGVAIDSATDDGGGEMLTSISRGDWAEYEIEVPYTGTYTMDYRLANEKGYGKLYLSVDDSEIDEIVIPTTGDAANWTTVQSSVPFTLTEGRHTIHLRSDAAVWNINWMDLSLECASVPIVPYVETMNSMGESLGRKQSAELTLLSGNTAILDPKPSWGGTWRWTGPNGFTATTRALTLTKVQPTDDGLYHVIYTNDCGVESTDSITIHVQDSLYIEAENYTSMSGVTVATTTDVNGISDVTSMSAGDWVEYTIEVPYAATYTIDFRVASASNSTNFDILLDTASMDQVTFESTGAAHTWTTVNPNTSINLEAGIHTLRLISNSDDWNINWLQLNARSTMRPCDYPLVNEGFSIMNTTKDWTSGLMDISCESKVDIYMIIEGVGNLEASDYLNIYYKIDGGEMVAITQTTGAIDSVMVSANGLVGDNIELIVQSHSGHLEASYNIYQITVLNGDTTRLRIEAEDYDDALGTIIQTTSDIGGGSNVGTIKEGNWLLFENIGLSHVYSINARISSIYSGGTMEVRLDSPTGTKVGTVDVPNTGNWQKWETVSAPLDSVAGVFDVYLVFSSPESSVGNINWIELSPTIIGAPSSLESNTVERIAQVYPNPVSDFVTISNSEGTTLEIYNIMGEMLTTQEINTNNQPIEMSIFRAGIYIFRVLDNGAISSFRIIKE